MQDQYGNTTSQQLFDYGNLTTPVRTYTNVFIANPGSTYMIYPASNYTSRYIYNRLLSTTLTAGSNTWQLVSNGYDSDSTGGSTLSDVPGIREHDANYSTAFYYRGNLTGSTTLSGSTGWFHDIGGNGVRQTVNGLTVSSTPAANTNWVAPATITAGNLTTSLNWNGALNLTSETGPNGDTASVGYDIYQRPGNSQSPWGASTTNTYNDTATPPTRISQTVSTGGTRWTRVTLDGLGRTYKTETGTGATTTTPVSVVDAVYGPCGCSPIGKLKLSIALAMTAAAYGQNYNGYLDAANCGTIGGWAWAGSDQYGPVSVFIYDGPNYVTQVLANQNRVDEGNHAFSITTPAAFLDGKPHTPLAYYNGGSLQLNNSGNYTFTCAQNGAGYSYYFTDNFTSLNSSAWQFSGTPATPSGSQPGFTSTTSATATSTTSIPGSQTQYEVKMTLALPTSGGSYYAYLRSNPSTGSYYAVGILNPTYSNGACTAGIRILKVVSNVATILSDSTMGCHTGMVVRVVMANTNQIMVYADNSPSGWAMDNSIASGVPAVSVSGAPAGNGIMSVALGPGDAVSPAQVNNLHIVRISPERSVVQAP